MSGSTFTCCDGTAAAKSASVVAQQKFMCPCRNAKLACSDIPPLPATLAQVNFYANATEYEPAPEQPDTDDQFTGPKDQPQLSTCAQLCPNLLNVACIAREGCWGRFSGALALYASVPLALALLWVAFRRGWLAVMLRALGRKPKPRQRRSSAGEREEKQAEAGGGGPQKKLAKKEAGLWGAAAAAGGEEPVPASSQQQLRSEQGPWGVTAAAGKLGQCS